MNMMMKALLVAGVIGSTTVAVANTAVNQAAVAASTPTTVKHALTLKDDSHVQLKGYVVKAIGDEKYEFRDQTGSITVDLMMSYGVAKQFRLKHL